MHPDGTAVLGIARILARLQLGLALIRHCPVVVPQDYGKNLSLPNSGHYLGAERLPYPRYILPKAMLSLEVGA
jgi:hypothetical protein